MNQVVVEKLSGYVGYDFGVYGFINCKKGRYGMTQTTCFDKCIRGCSCPYDLACSTIIIMERIMFMFFMRCIEMP